jgi:hypothetical protein
MTTDSPRETLRVTGREMPESIRPQSRLTDSGTLTDYLTSVILIAPR